MIKIINVIGTRPEAIKMAPVIKELNKYPEDFYSVVCSTGQHREMIEQVLSLFNIKPDYDLKVMENNQSLTLLTAKLITGLNNVVEDIQPDWVLAQGDTSTVMVASIVAFYNRIKFGHIEAGLRTGDIREPFPEELNRRVADMLAHLCFAPTERARYNLLYENYPRDSIIVTGNTIVDALSDVACMNYDWKDSVVPEELFENRIVLITAHRRESFGGPFRELCFALKELAIFYAQKNVAFIFPVHLNPNVRGPVFEILSDVSNIHIFDPFDYNTLIHLMKRTYLILTDSGGIQEEAPTFGVPVLVLRDKTERPESVDAGVSKVIGTNKGNIIKEVSILLDNSEKYNSMSKKNNPYGDGNASSRIVEALLRYQQRYEQRQL